MKKNVRFKEELINLKKKTLLTQDDIKFDIAEFRERIRLEDNLLNSRMNIFITLSALWLVVVSFIKDSTNNFTITLPFIFIGILITIIWLVCSYQSRRVISFLTNIVVTKLKEIEASELAKRNKDEKNLYLNKNFVEKTVQFALPNYIFKTRPTDLLSIWLPSLILDGWAFLVLKEIDKLNMVTCILSTIIIAGVASIFLYYLEKVKLKSFGQIIDKSKIFG